MKKSIIIMLLAIVGLPALAQHREVKLPEKPQNTGYRDYQTEEQGFWFSFEADGGSTIMEHRRNMQYVDATFTGGYRLNEFLRAGVGFGGRMYVNNADVRQNNSKFGVPVFVSARGNFISAADRDGVPFWAVRIGDIVKEGVYFSPAVGYSFGGERNNFQISLAYVLTNPKISDGSRQITSSFGLRLGYEF